MSVPVSENVPAIEARNIVVRRGNGVLALNELTTTVPATGITLVRGGIGSGKSTFLRTVVGLEKVDSGELRIHGETVFGDEGASRAIRSTVGYVSESLDLFQDMTVLQNLVIAPKLVLKQPAEQVESKAVALIDRLNLEKIVNRRASELSRGESQTVAIARALMMDPTILLLYEPVNILDPNLTKQVADLLLEWVFEDNNALVVATRIPPLADVTKEIVLSDGSVVENPAAERTDS